MNDTERLKWIMRNSGIDGFAGVSGDRYEYATTVAMAHGRNEPTEEDEFNGFRYLIDDAMMSTTPCQECSAVSLEDAGD